MRLIIEPSRGYSEKICNYLLTIRDELARECPSIMPSNNARKQNEDRHESERRTIRIRYSVRRSKNGGHAFE